MGAEENPFRSAALPAPIALLAENSTPRKGLTMKVLLLKDVYKLGRAGDVKKVADGYGRNFLLPQKLAMLATPGAVKQAEKIRQAALAERTRLNQEMGLVAEKLQAATLTFQARAGETGRLYGSITTSDIAAAIERETGIHIDRRHIAHQPLRELGAFKVAVRLTVDLIPEISVVVKGLGEEGEAEPEPEPEPAAPAAPAP
ncbi:MAG: 50S ribosomal protein L9 [Anaerolineales bacterium]|nr:50S ribosomal protein L9 [Anaerolineales bacterium]